MFAHRIAAFTGPEDVEWTEVPEPTAGPAADGRVIIDVAAAGVSFADLLQAAGAVRGDGRLGAGGRAAVGDRVGERAVEAVVVRVGGDRRADSVGSGGPDGRMLVLGLAGGDMRVVKVIRHLVGNAGVLGVGAG